jgi:enolase
LRDGDPQRYGGLGCRRAAGHISGEIQTALASQSFDTQLALDQTLIRLDGTPNKARLGANALLAVSLAFARACAVEQGIPLYQHFASIISQPVRSLPRLTVNLFSGGKHAGGQVEVQDVLVIPAAKSIEDGLAQVYAVYQAGVGLIQSKYHMRPLTADEGGLAPPFQEAEAMLADAVEAIKAAGLRPGIDIFLAVDVASSHFYQNERYHLGRRALDSLGMINILSGWLERYPILSIEDGLAEEDWEHWPLLCERIGRRALVLGDDLLCTNPARIQRAIDTRAANALLLKVNQIGTLTEAAEAYRLARSASWKVTISARSGETEDNWLADLAVGWSADQIKVGSITHSERLAKYNRLMVIEEEIFLK